MAFENLGGLIAGGFAIGLVRVGVFRYFKWKKARTDITLVADRRGIYRDPLDRKEWLFIAWLVFAMLVVIGLGYVILLGGH